MPFVRIDALRADSDRHDALGRAVHDAMTETIGIPPHDRFQPLTSRDGTNGTLRYDPDYLGVHRDDGIVHVAITMRSGRTPAQKQALYRRIAELASQYAGTEPRNVFVTLTENEPINWSSATGWHSTPTPPRWPARHRGRRELAGHGSSAQHGRKTHRPSECSGGADYDYA